jgi:hypothetical protein
MFTQETNSLGDHSEGEYLTLDWEEGELLQMSLNR